MHNGVVARLRLTHASFLDYIYDYSLDLELGLDNVAPAVRLLAVRKSNENQSKHVFLSD